ncbi:hypothetical protein [Hafnia alvei]|uniref:hypothetical protein n=1 Tax=Hafnia alvei TaxID=569 RepID=UPI000621A2AB|nr:hypothetical protein [Hafnia alvei]KKI41890.1 hypothetical protein XK86_18900 [Hafnia alvei]
MTKLTIESLEKFVSDIKADGMCDITDSQVESALIRLLAYEQAAKNPVAYRNKFTGQFFTLEQQPDAVTDTAVYEPVFLAAPVLPKQPKPTISFYRDGIIAAAKWVENQRDAYDNEHGQSDPETGSFEFGNNAQLEYSTTLSEIAEGIRSLHSVSAQPVSETSDSPVIPDGWKLVPIEPTAAMFHAFNDCDYGRKSMRERYIQMIEAAPARECENG